MPEGYISCASLYSYTVKSIVLNSLAGRFSGLLFGFVLVVALSIPNAGFSQGCLGAGGGGLTGGVISSQPGNPCANLDILNLLPTDGATIRVTVGNVQAGDVVTARINWNDGSPLVGPFPLVNLGGGTWEVVSAKHFFPATNTNCEYIPTTEIFVNGISCFANWGTPPVFFRWNIEGAANSPSSNIDVSETVTSATIFEVCAGVSTVVTFTDRSNLNCNSFPGDVTVASSLDNRRRWRQFIYGGAGALNTITGGVTVGGTPVPNGTGLNGVIVTYDITSGQPIGTAGGSDQPQVSGAFLVPPTSNNANNALAPGGPQPQTTQTLSITVPATAQVGEEFVITTNYWNTCNRYDQAAFVNSPFVYNATRIRVVGQPVAPTTPVVAQVCFGTTRSAMPTFSINTPLAGQTVRWYANVNGATPTVPGTVGALITTTVSGAGGASSIPFSTAFPGAGGTIMPSNNYIVWATYIGASGSINCESLPRSVVRSVRTQLDLTGQTITPVLNPNLCPSTAGHTYTLSMPAAPNPRPVGGNTEYFWTVPAGWTITGGQGSNQITVSLNATPSAGNVSVVWRYTSAPACTSGALNSAVTPLSLATAANPTGTNTICQDATTIFSSVVGGSGITMRWQVDIDGPGAGGFIDIPSVGGDPYSGETTASLTINTAVAGVVDQARYRIVVTGTCNTATSGFRTLTVNPKANISIQPVSAPNICINGTKVFTVTATGTAPLTYQWQVDADGPGPGTFINVPTAGGDPYTGETTASLTINTTGTGTTLNGANYRVIVNSTTCSSPVQSNSVTLTIQGPTVSITQGATASVCADSNLQLNGNESFLNGSFGSRAWTGTYDENFGLPPALVVLNNAQLDVLLTDGVGGSRRTALDPIFNSAGLGANKVGSYVLTLTTIDDNGCPNSATITINVTQVSASILHGPSAPATLPGNASVCSGIDLFLDGNPSGGSGTYTVHTWTIQSQPGGAVGSLSATNIRNPVFNFTTPGTYELSYFVQDNGGCTFDTNPAGNITITVNPLPTANSQTPPAICSDAALGTTGTVDLTLLQAAINGGGGITYTWWEDYNPGSLVFTNPIGTPAAYAVTNGNPVFARVQDANGCVNAATVTYTVNPIPANPSGAVNGIACDISPATMISVADPGPNTVVLWFSNAGLTIPAVGVTSGVRNQEFTPAVNSTTTYFAVVESTVAPTSCRSLGSLAVNHSQDISPTAAANFPDFSTCDVTANLSATPADNGGSGLWTLGGAIYYESFPATQNGQGLTGPSGAATFNHPSGNWSVSVPASALADNTDWIRVESGRIAARDVSDLEVVWESQTIVLTGPVDIRADIAEFGVQAAGDYIRVFHKVNGVEVQFGAIVDDAVDGVFQTVTANGIGAAGNTFQVVMRAKNNGATDEHRLDNVIVSSAGTSLPVLADPSDPLTSVSNLQVGANTFTWTITSALGACAPTMDQVTVTRHALPLANDPVPVLCENSFGSADATITPAYLATLDNLVNGGNPAHTVQYFSAPTRLPGDLVVASFQVSTTDQIYTRVTRTDVFPQCTQDGVVTFTVNPLPAAIDQVYSVCEESVGSADKDNNDLPVLFDNLVTGGAASRSVAWYFDPGGPVSGPADLPPGNLIPSPNDVDNVTDGTLFYALVTNTVTNCQNVASVEYDLQPRPGVNPILGAPNVCKGTSLVFYQLTNVVPGSTYAWTFPPNNPGFFEVVFGGGVNDAFVVLRFPNITTPPTSDVYNISVIETSPAPNSCTGVANNFTITVDDSPAANPILGLTNVCKGQTGVTYQVTNPNVLNTYAWSISAGDASIVGSAAGVGRTSIIVDFGISNSAIVEVIETSPSGCSLPAAQTLVVNASDSPSMSSANAATICSGLAPSSALSFTATLPSTFAWQVFSVTGSVTTGGLPVPIFPAPGSTGTGDISHVLSNISGSIGTVTYLVTPTESTLPSPPNCPGPTQVVTITVQPEPVLASPQIKTICSGASTAYEILLIPPTLPAGTTFTWPAPVMSDASGQGSASPGPVIGGPAGTIHITDVLTNTSNAPITATYTITPTSGAGCPGTPQTVVVNVNPQPVISAGLDATRCSDAATGLVLAVSGTSAPAANYNITARSIAIGLTAAGANAFAPANGVAANYLSNDAFTNTTANPLTVTYTVVGVSASGCVGAPMVITQTIDPEPVVSPLLDVTRCSDEPIALNLNTNGTSVAAATYNINSVTVAPGLLAGGGNAVVPAAGVAVNYLATDVFTNTGASPLTVVYSVVPVSAAGCLGNARTITITINPEPVVSTTLNTAVCSDAVTGLTLATNGTSVAASNYNVTARTISPGLVAAGTNVAVPASGVAAGYLSGDRFTNSGALPLTVTYTVEGVSAASCISNPQVITITINPEPVMSAALNATVCSDTAIGLILNTDGASVAAATYNITARSIQAGLTPGGSNALVTATGVAANYLANDQFTNTGAAPLTVTYTVVPVSAAGCAGDPLVVTITINPEPVVAATLDASVCSDDVIALTLNTNGTSVAAVNYNITARSIAGGLIAGGGNAIVPAVGVATNYLANDTYTNTGALPLTVTYTVVGVSADGCVGDARVITRIINPEPVVSTTLNTTVCSDAVTGLVLNTNGTSVGAFNYNITALVIDPGLVPAGGNAAVPSVGVAANFLASDRFTNTGNTPLTVSYTVQALSSASCLGNPQVITVTINPEPVMSNALDLTQCSNVPIGLVLGTNGTSEPAINYNIVGQAISVGLVAAGGNVPVPANGVAANYLSNHTFTNSTSLSLLVEYLVVPVSASGCLGDSKLITITIDAGPIVANNLDATVCSDAPIGLNLAVDASSAPAANYNITARTIAGGLVAGGGNAVVPFNNAPANYLAADTYTNTGAVPLTVTYTVVGVGVSGCLGNPRVITMTINPEPVVASTLNATVCSDANIGLILNTNGTSVAALDYSITARTISPGLTAAGSNAVVPATGVGTNYLTSDRFTNTGAVPLTVTYTVTARSAAGCTGDPQVITITINPEPVVAGTLNATLCSDIPTGLTLNTNGTSVAAANYNITAISIAAGLSAAGGNAVVPAAGVAANYLSNDVFTNTGALPLTVVYTVVPVSAAGCQGDALAVTMTINPEPVVSTTLDATVCSDLATGLTLNTNGSSVAAATYNVTASTVAGALVAAGGNAAVPAFGVAANYLANDMFTNTTGGSLTVTYTVVPVSADGCVGNSRVITLTISPEPVVSALLNATVCSDAVTGLTLNTNGTSVIAASYNVTARTIAPGLTAAGTNVAVPANGVVAGYLAADRFTNTGAVPLQVTYTVEGISSAGCIGNPQVITITIEPEPVVSNALDLTQCSDVAIGLTLNTNGTSVAAATYNITARSVSAGLTIGAGNAVITANGVAANYLAADVYTNTGASPLTVTYTVVPVSAAGCTGDAKVITVTINPEPVVSTLLDATVCSDLPVNLTLNTNGSSVAAATYNVSAITIAPGLIAAGTNAVIPGNGVAANYLANDVFTNPTAGSLTVAYTVAGVSAAGCLGNTRVITMTINPEPVISPALDATVCSDVATGLTLNTNGTSVAALNYDIVSRTIAGGLTPAGTNAPVPANGVGANYLAADRFTNTGAVPLTVTYTVQATSAAGCIGDTRVITLTIEPEPVASNTLNLTQCSDVAIGLVLNTDGVSVGAATYNITSISIGAGLTAAGGNAVVPAAGVAANYLSNDQFTNTGAVTRTVTYVIVPVSAAGCTGDPRSVVVTIEPEPVVSAGLNATICSDNAIALNLNTNGTSVAAANYNITASSVAAGLVAGGGNAAIPAVGVASNYLANDVFTNNTSGALTVTYTVVGVSAAGCLGDARVITMTISPEPIVSTTLNATVCSDIATGLTLNTTGASVAAVNYNVTAIAVAPGLVAAGTNAVVPFAGVPANYLAADRFTNPTAAPLTVDYTVVAVSAGGCVGDPQVITMTIAPEPVVSPALDLTQCSDTAIGLILNTDGTSVAAANYNITARNISAGLVAAGSNAVVTANGVPANYLSGDQYTNNGALPLTVTYTVVPISAAGCVGDARVITVTISPEPVVAATLNASVCSDQAVGLTLNTNGTSVAAASYNITAQSIAGGLIAAGGNAAVPANTVAANYLANDVFTNPTNAALTVTYTVVPVSAAGCLGDPRVVTMTINPEPVVSPALNATRCSDAAIGLTLATNGTSVAAAAYNITARTIDPALIPGGANVIVPAVGVAANYLINDTFTNTGAVPLLVTYTVVPVSAALCVGDPVVITMTIEPEPVVANGLDATVCSDVATGLTLNTNGTSVGAGTYNITGRTVGAGLAAGAGNAIVPATGVAANYLAADMFTNTTTAAIAVTYTVVPVSAAGCAGDPKVITIIINPEPVISNGLDANRCSDIATGLTITTIGTSASAANFNVTGVVIAPGLIAGGGNAAIPAVGVAPNYLASDVFTNPGTTPLTVVYTVVPVTAAGCLGDAKAITITIGAEPVGVNDTKTICSDAAVTYDLQNNVNTLGNGFAANFSWIAAPNASVTGESTVAQGGPIITDILNNVTNVDQVVTYTVTPTGTNGCVGNAFTVTVTVQPEPVGLNDVATINSDIILNYDLQNNVNTLGNNLPANFSWTASINTNVSGESTTPQAGALITDVLNNVTNANQTVLYTVVPTGVNGCVGNPFSITVTVLPEPMGFNDNVTVNSDVNINYNLQNNVNSGGNSVPATFVWQAADNPLVTGESLGPQPSGSITDIITNTTGVDQVVVYTVIPTGTNGVVGDPFTVTVTIRSEPVGANDVATVCSDIAVSYDLQNNLNTLGNGQAATFTWFAAANPNVTGESTALQSGAFITDALNNVTNADEVVIYTVTPTGTNGAPGNPFTITVTVQPEPVVATNLNETQCSGVVYGKLLATNGTSIGAATYDVTVVSKDAGITGGRPLGLIGGGASAANVIQNDSYTNTTAIPQTVVYSVVPNGTNGCIGNAVLVVFTINPEPVLFNPGFPAVCSSNTSGSSIVNVVLGTNGTSATAATYQLMNIQYSNGGPFGPGLPPGFTALGGNAIIGAVGNIDLVRNDRYNNTLAVPVTVRYTVQGTSATGCLSATLDYDVAINPEPTLDPLLNPTPVCSGLPSGVTLGVAAGSVAATAYNINSILFPGLTAGGANTGIGNNKPANAIFNDVYVNTTNGVLTATYQISPVSAAGCVGPEGTVTLTINPSPDLANTLNRTVCTNTASGIVFSTTAASVAAVSYNLISVTPQAGLVPAGGNAAFPAAAVTTTYVNADQFTNPTNNPLTVTYRVEPVSGAGCIGPQEDIILTVEPSITAAPINLKPTVCSGSGNGNDLTDIELISPANPSAGVITFNYTAVSSIGTQITGFVPALNGLAENYKITDNLVNASNSPATVTYTITPVASGGANGAGCSGVPSVVVVTVEPKPKLVAAALKTVCEGVATAISLTSPTTPSAGTIEFLLVTAVPTGGVTGASANGTVFANGSTLNDVLSNPTTTAQTVTYTFRPRFNGGAGCLGDDVVSVVTVNPRPTVTPSPQPEICSGDVVDITLTTDVVNTVSTWTVTAPATITGESAGAGDRIFQILFNNGNDIETVTYNVTPQANGCAGATVPVNVTVNPKAKVLGVPSTITICHGGTLNIPLTSNVVAGVTYAWTVDDPNGLGIPATGSGNVINQPMSNTLGFQATLTYTITPTGPGLAPTGCVGESKIMIVTVSPEITAGWLNTPSPANICLGSTEYLVLNIGGRAPFNFTYNDGGAPINKTNQPPVAVLPHAPTTNTTYTLTSITDGLGCTTAFNEPFVVNVGDTDPNYTIISPTALCSPNEVSFQYNQVTGTIYTWRFGDSPDSVYQATTTVPNMVIKHTYTNLSPTSTLNYPVTMQTELPAPFPGCFETTPAKTVTIYPNVITNVLPNKTEICSGEIVAFTNSSVGTNAQTWSYRVQGQVPETAMGSTFNMNFAFTNTTTANPIIYEVIFRSTNGLCPAPDVIMPIQVYRLATANFSEGVVPDFVNGESLVTFTNTTDILDGAAFTYDWVFGPDAVPPNASAIAPGTIQYVSPGPKDITLTVTNNARSLCKTTFTKQINIVLPPLVAKFDATPYKQCFPAKISVSQDPAKTEITGDIIEWSVVDQNNRLVATSSGVFPEFVLPAEGEYRVSVVTRSSQTGQVASYTHDSTFVVFGKPQASFDARPDIVFVPDTEMTLFNFSPEPDKLRFTWDFGDGDVLAAPPAPSNEQAVPLGTHNDRTKGTYEEPIHIYKVEGVYDVTMIVDYDHGEGVVCSDTIQQQVQARQGGVTKVPNAFTPSTGGPSGGQSGNGTFNDVFLPIVKGADEYNLQIYDRWGNLIFESNSSQVGWDGYNANGQLLPAGVYVYKLTVRLSDGQRSTQVGDVTMIR